MCQIYKKILGESYYLIVKLSFEISKQKQRKPQMEYTRVSDTIIIKEEQWPKKVYRPLLSRGAQAPKALQTSQQLMLHMPPLNWSHFKPKFSGKPEDAEAHLLRTNDWMDTHRFQEDNKVQRFCLT